MRRIDKGKLSIVILFVLLILVGAGNLLATRSSVDSTRRQFQAQQAQQKAIQKAAGILVENKLCTSFGKLAALKPPSGASSGNPSRQYDQKLHDVLVGLGQDIGCRK